eukprot:scaffold208968_cov17-Tisochrysis_lutea.AAC.1
MERGNRALSKRSFLEERQGHIQCRFLLRTQLRMARVVCERPGTCQRVAAESNLAWLLAQTIERASAIAISV